jgi:hypothetical protein
LRGGGLSRPTKPTYALLRVIIRGAAILGEQVAIKRIITIAEECPRAAVATLGDVVRVIGDDDTGEAGHATWCMKKGNKSI